MKKILFYFLRTLASKILKKYRPLIIGITGSVGKTSAKEAIFAVIRNKGRVRKSEGNYNNEIGVPLTIIGSDTGGRSIFKWLKIFAKAYGLLFKKHSDYPEILIVEMGAEKAGDIEYLTEFVPVDIGVLTGINKVHLEFFKNFENIIEEKFKLFRFFNNQVSKIAVVNLDDENIKSNLQKIKAKIISYGFSDKAELQTEDFKIIKKNNVYGTLFRLGYQESKVPVFLPNIFGRQHIYACLAALGVDQAMGGKLMEAVDNFAYYRPPKGRVNLISGIKNTLIIDDTYNSSPTSSLAALEVLNDFPEVTGKRIAVFGKMLELGNYQEQGHLEVGKRAAEMRVDMLIAVGEMARDILRGATEAGLPEEKTFYFAENNEAGRFIQNKLYEGDLILIKGSQGARMERLVKELMAEPLKAEQLLVRQSEKWLKK